MNDSLNTTVEEKLKEPVKPLKWVPETKWMADNVSNTCMVMGCQTEFSLFEGRHHCRICGILVCAKCSKYRAYNEKKGVRERVCRPCFKLHRARSRRLSTSSISSTGSSRNSSSTTDKLHARCDSLLSHFAHDNLVQEALEDDGVVLKRFLKTCSDNVEKAHKKLEECLQWREENNVNEALEWGFPDIEKRKEVMPFDFFHGDDGNGHLIIFSLAGQVNIPNVLKFFSREDIDSFHDLHISTMEYERRILFPKLTEEYREEHDDTSFVAHKHIAICDMNGFSLAGTRKLALDFFSHSTTVDQKYYPDGLYKCIVINAPWAFAAVWSTIKVFLDENTKENTIILSSDYSQELRKYISEDRLPSNYGGSSPYALGQHPMELKMQEYFKTAGSEEGRAKPSPRKSTQRKAEASSESLLGLISSRIVVVISIAVVAALVLFYKRVKK